MRHAARDGLFLQRAMLGQAQHDIGEQDRGRRRQREQAQPFRQLRHARAEHDEIGGIGDRQHEARGIGNEGADEQIGQRLGAGRACRGIDRRRQHDGGGIIREQHGDDRADDVDQQEQPLRRAGCIFHRKGREIVEQAFEPGELRDQHHADQEEIDVDALLDAGERILPWQEAEQDQGASAEHGPDRLGQAKRADNDARGRDDDDAPGPDGVRRHVQSFWREFIWQR